MLNIAIDGFSGAGKSTIAKLLAKRLNIAYLDTGAMYRALGLKALRYNIDPKDEAAAKKMLESTTIDVAHKNGVQHVFLDGEDVTDQLREHAISKMASDISAVPAVRVKMAEMQRNIAHSIDCVLEGRDIGSYVLPDCRHKFFLTASLDVRANRRRNELLKRGVDIPFEQIKKDIEQRDKNDMSRDFAPLKLVDDAIVIDSSNLTVNEVVEKFIEHIGENPHGKSTV